MAYTTAQRKTILTKLGFRVSSNTRYVQAIRDFQRGWNLGEKLKEDGKPGPITDSALEKSWSRYKKRLGTASLHFSFSEFACKCGGRYAACRRIWVHRTLLQRLEKYRTATKRSLKVISGCRCEGWNRVQKGASKSQHKYGKACDVLYYTGWTSSRVASLKLFSGIGRSKKTGLVRHVDIRVNASVNRPVVWNYAS